MDNAPIHTSTDIRKIIEDHGYKCVYLPPYSPFLNPIEEFWSKVKAGVRRDGLIKDDNLNGRITESSLAVTPKDCQGWIRHAIQFSDRCKAGETNLLLNKNCFFFFLLCCCTLLN